jgi:putative transcriptional regulator
LLGRIYYEKELFDELSASIKEAGAIKMVSKKPSRVFDYSPLNIKKIREKFSLTQAKFAEMISVSLSTLQNWEQGSRVPHGPAKLY